MVTDTARVLAELRRARRRRHLSDVDLSEAFYRVYVTAIFGTIGVATVSGYAGGNPVTQASVRRVTDHGAAAAGLVIAAIVGLGLRSGARGGPIALEPADVHIVLLAPVSRRRALLAPALRQFRFALFVGATAGAVVGNLASRRLPGGAAAWVASGAGAGAASAVAAVGAALVVSGLRAKRWASVAALALLAWSTVDLLAATATSPTTFLGQLALRPVAPAGAPWLGVAAVLLVGSVGLALLGGTPITAAQQRAALLAQLRFAVTMQDVRTVVLLRRVLAQEEPRSRPWIGLRRPSRHPVWRRDAQGALRWRATRLGRLLLLGVTAAGALVVVWHGTAALIVLAGAALFVAALDAAEGLGQEYDLPGRRDTLPVDRRWLTLQHMVAPLVVMIAVAGAGVIVVAVGAVGRAPLALSVGAPTILTAAIGAVCGAVVSVASEPFDPLSPELLFVPELVASTRFLVRVGAAPGLAVLGVLPVLAAQSRTGAQAAAAAAGTAGAIILTFGVALFFMWPSREGPA